MRWDQTEYLLKGVYLGLLVMVALHNPTWNDVAILGACTLGGLILALAWVGFSKLRDGFKVEGRVAGFLLFLLLENPRAVFTGVVAGLTFGAYLAIKNFGGEPSAQNSQLVFWPLIGGAGLGIALWYLRSLKDAYHQMYLGLGLAAALVGGAIAGFWYYPLDERTQTMIGALMLLGIPGFYLLSFASLEEESEMEIAALCAALGIGLWALGGDTAPPLRSLRLLLPLAIYYVYSVRILPELRVFKHALRGLSYRQVKQVDRALASLGRALELNPRHALAREQLWDLHRQLDFNQIKDHPKIVELINIPMCLDRVADLLLADRPQSPQIQESLHLLDIVEHKRPELAPACWYWRAVAECHCKNLDDAVRNLETLLAGVAPADPKIRRRWLFSGWNLALLLHPEMKRRVGTPLIEQPARRFEAIGAVEREIARAQSEQRDDTSAWDLKRFLYGPVTEPMYLSQTPEGKVRDDFDYGYVKELGLALLDQPEPWRRGIDFLRIAARGLPLAAPALYVQIAKAHEKHGDGAGMWAGFQSAMKAARAAGLANLSTDDRQNLFTVIKQLGDRAIAENRVDEALEAFKFYSQKDEAGIETYRMLAELFERKKDVWNALHCVEHALTYNANDPDLLARKDRYYYSLTPADLKARELPRWFDADYCLTKSQFLLEKGASDLDLLDWAGHLAELLGVAQPASLQSLLLRARARRLRGEIPEAIELLEKVRQNKPEKFAGEAEEDAWYVTHRLLGDLYLDQNPAEAAPCFLEFRKSSRAGADTMYKLGRAYEALGDLAKAARCYEEVTTFTEHPLFYDARDGLERVKRGKVRG